MAKILVVDNSQFSRECIKKILTGHGHEVIGEAGDAQEGFDSYQSLRPDLVTVDLVMPKVDGMDGLGLIQKLIRHDAQAKVIAVSAMAQDPVIAGVMSAGACFFVKKPLNEADLIQKVNESLALS